MQIALSIDRNEPCIEVSRNYSHALSRRHSPDFCKTTRYDLRCTCPHGDITLQICLLIPQPCTAINNDLRVAQYISVWTISTRFSRTIFKCRPIISSITISTAEDTIAQHTALDMNKGTTTNSSVWTATKDTIPYIRNIITISHMHESVALNTSKFRVICSLWVHSTITTCKYLSKDITANDVYEWLCITVSITCDIILWIERGSTFGITRWCRSLYSHVGNITTAIYRAKDLRITWDCDRSRAFYTSHILEIGKNSLYFRRLNTCTTAEQVAIYIATICDNSSIATHFSKVLASLYTTVNFCILRQFLVCRQLSIATTEHTMHERITSYGNISISFYNTCITATNNAMHRKTWNTITIVIHTNRGHISSSFRFTSCITTICLTLGFKSKIGRLCKLLVCRRTTQWRQFIYAYSDLGRTYGCICTITTTKHRVMRILIVAICPFPYIGRKEVDTAESSRQLNCGNARTCSTIKGKNLTSLVTTTIYIMLVDEYRLFLSSINEPFPICSAPDSIPLYNIPVMAIPFLVPYHRNTTNIYVCWANDIRRYFRTRNITLTTTKYFSRKRTVWHA